MTIFHRQAREIPPILASNMHALHSLIKTLRQYQRFPSKKSAILQGRSAVIIT